MRKPIVTALSVMLSAAITLSLTATASYAQDEVTADTAPNTVQTQAQPETEATIQPEANTQSETNTAEAQTQAPAQSETDAQPQTESETQPGPNAQTQPQATTTTQPEAQPETQPAPETQQDTATPLQTQSTDNTIRAAMNGYAHSASSDPQNGITLTAYWNDPKLGSPTTFHVEASGGSGNYQFRMDAPSYSNPDKWSFESVADPSRGEWTKYTAEEASHDYTFTMTASGTYNYRFFLMDKASSMYYMRVTFNVQVSDPNYPSVADRVNAAVAQCNKETDGSEYAKALWLHDWLLDQMQYDNSLKWSSAESALTRGLGTCQSYESAYSKLLTAAGIENSETRDTYDAHTWNAVKLDGKWYQVDCTWDDSDDHWYNFDQRHLYFGLTDELMAIAHTGHTKTYQADGYATRSTSLEDNYFVRNGDAKQWADSYADRIQKHLDALETSFTIGVDNDSYPPSIKNIVNGITAYAMNQETWKIPNHTVQLTATRKDDSNFAFAVKYNDIPVDSITISGDGVKDGKITLKSGESVQLTATVKPDNATNKKVTWTSSDSAIASVSSTGLVKAEAKAGTTKVTAAADDTTASITITVSGQTDRAVLDTLAEKHRSDLADGTYVVGSNLSRSRVLDVANGSQRNGANVQLWTKNGTKAQDWVVSHDKKGYVTLTNTGSGKALDVSEGKAFDGANVQQRETDGTWAQKWIAVRTGSSYKLVSALDLALVLDVRYAFDSDGTNVWLYSSNNSQAQQWTFKTDCAVLDTLAEKHRSDLADGTYVVGSNLSRSRVLDVANGSQRNGANVQLWTKNGTKAQDWVVSHDKKGYVTLTNTGSGKALDVSEGKAFDGANVQQRETDGTWAQKWIAVRTGSSYKLVSALDLALVLDVRYAFDSDGTNVWLYSSNNSQAQQWTFRS